MAWAEAVKLYNWLAGSNRLSLDLQQAKDLSGGDAGFYAGIGRTGAMTDSLLATTALTLFSMVRASYTQVPEFTSTTSNVSITHQALTSTSNSTTATSLQSPYWLTAAVTLGAIGLLVCFAALAVNEFRSHKKSN